MRLRVSVIGTLVLFSPAITNGQQAEPAPPPAPAPQQDHAQHEQPPQTELPAFIPPITDEGRRAAFPDVTGHAVHDNAINYFVLFDQLEWQTGSGQDRLAWEAKGWVGRDLDRLWLRTEGERRGGRVGDAQAHVLYGRAIARWWDVVAGVRQDMRPGPARTWAAVGIQGLAPYWFEVEATAYVGAGGRTHFRFETEYELLLTNRLILQPLLEIEIYGKSDPERDIGAGLSTADTGLRVRYEFRREFAPYIGMTWNRVFFGTADAAKAAADTVAGTRLTAGFRFWL